MKAEEQNVVMSAAYDLIDFCEGDIKMSTVKRFWFIRSEEYNVTDRIKQLVLSMAYSLIIK